MVAGLIQYLAVITGSKGRPSRGGWRWAGPGFIGRMNRRGPARGPAGGGGRRRGRAGARDCALGEAGPRGGGLRRPGLGGGPLEPVPAYNSSGLGLIPPAAVADEALELLAEGGFTALKVRVGRDRAADDLEAVRRVRAAAGGDVTLVADYNQGLALGDALQRCPALDAEGLTS